MSSTATVDTPIQLTNDQAITALFRIAEKEGFPLIRGSDLKPFEFIQSGVADLDSIGAVAYARFTVIYGPTGAAKSTFTYLNIAAAQKEYPDKICVVVDVEHRIDPIWMQRQGVDLNRVILLQGLKSLEQNCNAVIKLVRTGLISLVAIDTVSQMVPEVELEDKTKENLMERDHVAQDARKIKQFIRATNVPIFKANTACILVAQARTHGIGSMYTYVGLSGGHMLKHMALKIWQFTPLKSNTDATFSKVAIDGKQIKVMEDFKVRALLEKDTGPNERQAWFLKFIPGVGFDLQEIFMNNAIRDGFIPSTSKSRFEWTDRNGDIQKLHGRQSVVDYFIGNPEEKDRLQLQMVTAHKERSGNIQDDEAIKHKWVTEEDEEDFKEDEN